MIHGATENLQEKIVRILASRGMQTTIEIKDALIAVDTPTTLQGIYRVLRGLNNDGVVVKEGQRYSLRIPWIVDLSTLVTEMEHQYLQPSYLGQILPKKNGQKRIWYFSDLAKLNNYWSQVLIAMAQTANKKVYLNCSTHLWMDLIHPAQERQFLRALFEQLESGYTVVSERTYLDNIYEPHIINGRNYEYIYYAATPEEAIEKDPSTYVDIVDDFVLTITLPKKMTKAIDDLFTRVHSAEELRNENLAMLTELRGKIKMTIKKSPDTAQKYHKRFERIFGPIR